MTKKVFCRRADFEMIDNEGCTLYMFYGDKPGEEWIEVRIVEPIDMVLYCPKCHKQHIDAPDLAQAKRGEHGWEPWDNPPHRSHLCGYCGHIWRPADVATNGVASIKTKGAADS